MCQKPAKANDPSLERSNWQFVLVRKDWGLGVSKMSLQVLPADVSEGAVKSLT